MAIDNFKNGSIATVSGIHDAAVTVINLVDGHADKLPAATFQAVWWNDTTYPGDPSSDPNYEIVRCTSKSNAPGANTATVVRGQETADGAPAASAKNTAGVVYKLAAVITAKFFQDIRDLSVDVGTLTVWVTDKGAKGDGVTDDRAAIQTAIDAGTDVVFPPGIYLISAALVLKNDLRFRGAGRSITTIKLKDNSGTVSMLTGTNLTRTSIESMAIDGNEAQNTTALDGISANGADRLRLFGLTVTRCRRNGISMGKMSGDSKHVEITHCDVDDCRENLIEIQNRGSANVDVKITNCNLVNPASAGASNDAGIKAWGRVMVDNVTIETVTGNNYGVWLMDDDATFGAGAHESHISNVHVAGSSHATNISMGFRVEADRCSFVGCSVDSCDIGFRLGLSGTTGDDNTLTACQTMNGDAGIQVDGDRNRITSCYVRGTPTVGIDLAATAQDTFILGSHITGTTKVAIAGGATLHARNNTGWKTHSRVQTPDQSSTAATGIKDVLVAHTLDVTPGRHHCNLSLTWESATPPLSTENFPSIRGPFAYDGDVTNIKLAWQLFSTGIAGNYRVTCDIDVYP